MFHRSATIDKKSSLVKMEVLCFMELQIHIFHVLLFKALSVSVYTYIHIYIETYVNVAD